MGWTTDELVTAVKLVGQAPSARWQFTDSQVLDIAFRETLERFIPAIRAVREDYFTTFATIPLLANTASYRMPRRASSVTIKQVLLVQTQTNGRAWPVTRVTTSEGWRGIGQSANTPWAYVIEGSSIRLLGTPTNIADYQLRVYYQRRPSRYVPVASSSVVASKTATTIVLTGAPSWFVTGDDIDVMSPEPEADLLMQDTDVTLAGSTFTITDGDSTAQVAAGDYVSKADTTPIVLLPDAFWQVLVDATAAECMRSTNNYDGAATLESKISTSLPGIIASITPRAESQPLKAFNKHSPLRSRGYRTGRWGSL
jgi:hypothetical protein